MLLTELPLLVLFNLAVGVLLGSILYRSDFCMAGVFRDIFLLRDYSLFRPLVLLVLLTAVLFSVARLSGLILLKSPPVFSYPSLATVIGGFAFGIGMVLAGGCVVSTVYKMAAGNLASLIAFLGMIAGSMLYAESHPWWDLLRTRTALTKNKMFAEIMPEADLAVLVAASVLSLALFLHWKRRGILQVEAYAEGYLQPWKAAVMIAVLNAAVYVLSGWPLGITTGYAKIAAMLENLVAPAHVAGLRYFNLDSISVVLPDVRVSGGAGPRADIILFTQIPLLIGIALGAFFTALALKEFKIYGLPPKRQIASALMGGILLGLGARIASGCNVTFVLGGVPLFVYQAFLFTAAMLLGAYAGVRMLRRLVIP